MIDPFAPKCYSLIQNNIDPNIGDELNFVACEQSFTPLCELNVRFKAGFNPLPTPVT